MFSPIKYESKSSWMYFEWLKYLNKLDSLQFPLIIIPNHNIQKAYWKFTSKHPQINKIYAKKLNIRITDNLPISQCSTFILSSSSEVKSPSIISSEINSKFEQTYFKIYEAISKINRSTEISLSLEIYQSVSSLKNIIELVAGINLTKLSLFIKSFEYDKNQEDHNFIKYILDNWQTLKNFKFNFYRFNNLCKNKVAKAKKLIDQYFIEESLMNYSPTDVWDLADF